MSEALARVIWRFRFLLCFVVVAGALLFAPSVGRTTIDNDLTSWFSPDDPIYQQYERFRDEFGGTRNLIVAIKAPSRARMFEAATFRALDEMSADIERVDAVERVSSLATATVVDARPAPPRSPLIVSARWRSRPRRSTSVMRMLTRLSRPVSRSCTWRAMAWACDS